MRNCILKIKQYLFPLYYKYLLLPYEYRRRNEQALLLGKKDKIKVVFFAMNISMWKYQHLYDFLKKDKRFCLYIIISPAINFTREKQVKDVIQMRKYFVMKEMPFIDCEIEVDGNPYDVRGIINPDIVFHTQPYEGALVKEHAPSFFKDKLLCYCPYSYKTLALPHNYNLDYFDHAWKLYVQNHIQYELYRKRNPMKARNVVVVGYPKADDFFSEEFKDVWKPQLKRKKRVIWAPHFTLEQSVKGMQARSNFLWMAPVMMELAKKYADSIQFTFKPHPRLLSELYRHPDWGKDKAESYYEFWRNTTNTQLEEGDFVDLFKGSDAIIHDSGSFLVDYMYVQNPAMFVTDKLDKMLEEADDFAKQVYGCYYIGKCEEDIISFIEDIVLGDKDELEGKRQALYNHYLIIGEGKTVTQNILDDLYQSLGLNER
ncbi:MAG: CDP-glycerol glycerophosphotransferase family protein [Prevotella sp.]|nr:CDP-glycerol glycerophosphotransferase family protein [Prevotella sp.]